MTRSFSAHDLIILPRLSSASAATLGHRLLKAARKQPSLPTLLAASHGRLQQTHGELRESRKYMHDVQKVNAAAATEADLWVDTAWGAFHSYLQGWARLPARRGEAAAKAERAKVLLEGVFPEGLRFLKLPYELEWAETEKRLDRLLDPDYAEHVAALGAEPFVETIREAFEAYGAALHGDERSAGPKAAAKVREPLDRFVAALRGYVLSVTAYGHAGGEGSGEQVLADALLAPLAAWQPPGGRKGKGEPDVAGDDGAEGDDNEAGEPVPDDAS
ncbi:MAG TPA: hypothetical protein VFS43_29535 [Polyangiaceae bacterium]|nr:hypothetical protein [Polyangiaceae bacterium]